MTKLTARVPSYSEVHIAVWRERGRAANRPCQGCGTQARYWAYDQQSPEELFDPSTGAVYCLDTDHYIPLCGPCHYRLDRERNQTLARPLPEVCAIAGCTSIAARDGICMGHLADRIAEWQALRAAEVAKLRPPKERVRRRRGTGSLRLLRSGRWRAQIMTGDGYVPAPTTFDTREAAEAWLADQVSHGRA